jgi:hypothetical protein
VIEIREIISNRYRRIVFGLQIGFVSGQIVHFYFQSQTNVAAIIKNGTNFSATMEKLKPDCGDKDLGSELYILYMFICL